MSIMVSVIIPAYNAGKYISDAINSILTQSYNSDIEIIVIDDGSSDNTRAIVDDISLRNSNIILLTNERNHGPSGARNTGLIRSVGKYVAFLDADDIWLPCHLEEGVSFLEKYKNIGVVFFNFKTLEYETKNRIGDWFSDRNFLKILKTRKIDKDYYLICDDMFNALIDESFVHLQSTIVRKKILNDILFNEEIKRSEDRDFSIKLYTNSYANFAFKNIVTGTYYRHQKSLTSQSIENALSISSDHITLFKDYLSNFTLDKTKVRKLKKLLFDRYLDSSYCNRKLKNYKLAFISLFNSLRYRIVFSQLLEFLKIVVSIVFKQT